MNNQMNSQSSVSNVGFDFCASIIPSTISPELPPRPSKACNSAIIAEKYEREKQAFRSIDVPEPDIIPSWPCMFLRQHAGSPNRHGSQVIVSDIVRQLIKNELGSTEREIDYCAKYKENLIHEIKTNKRLRDTLREWETDDFSPWISAAEKATIITSPGRAMGCLVPPPP